MPRYSFVMPAYKGRFFEEALMSILRQTYTDFELIVVDDASPDPLGEMCARFPDRRLRYIRHDVNTGGTDLVAQWNKCLGYASGTYVVLASDDDIYHPEYLATMDGLTRTYPEVDALYPQVRYIDADGRELRRSSSGRVHYSAREFLEVYSRGALPGGIPQYMWRREALMAAGGFVSLPTAWRSDDATALRMSVHGVAVAEECLFSFRYSGINISSRVDDVALMRRKLRAERDLYRWARDSFLPTTEADELTRQHVLEHMRNICLWGLRRCRRRTLLRLARAYLALDYTSVRMYASMLLRGG